MIMRKRYTLLLLSILTMMTFLISACSQPGIGVGTGTGSATPRSSLTPLQVLQNSANAMKQLKSSHIEIQSTDNVQTTSVGSVTPTASGTPVPNNSLTLTIKGTGDQALPDQEQINLTVNDSAKYAQILQGDKVYVQNAQGQWFVLNKNAFQGTINSPFNGVALDQNALLALVQHSKITDHGTETLNAQILRHITADLDKTALRQLLTDNPQMQAMFGQQNIDTILNNTKTFAASIDVYIDESKFYVHRTQLRLDLTADTGMTEGTAPSTVSTKLNTIVDLSKFNDPITITPPTNATPTDNPAAIFGFGRP